MTRSSKSLPHLILRQCRRVPIYLARAATLHPDIRFSLLHMAFSSMGFDINPSMVLLLAVAPLLSYLLIRRISGGRRWRYHPIAGSELQMILNLSRVYDYVTEICTRHKSFRIRTWPFHSHVYTADPVVIEHVLRSNFQNYGKGSLNYEHMSDLFGDGIFVVDGVKWRHQRKLASYELSTRALKMTSGDVFKKISISLAKFLAQVADSGRVVDIQDWFMTAAMDTIFEVSFGVELNTLQGRNAETEEFVRALDKANELVCLRYMDPLWKLKRFLNFKSYVEVKTNMRIVDDYVFKLIRSKVDQMADSERENHDLLSRFLLERENDPEKLSDRYLRDIIISIIIAGKDTTAGSLSWMFYLLCKHPDVEQRIFKEVKQAVRAEDGASVEEFVASLTEESLSKMTYLHAAMVETLRLYPAAPMDGKICFSDDILPDGYAVRAGEFVQYLPYCMGRMKDLWGDDAEIFRPERWLDADGKFCPESPFKFTAFQAGPRICLGKEFAYREMKVFSAVLIRFFTFKLRDEKESGRYKLTLTLLMDPGLNVHVFRR